MLQPQVRPPAVAGRFYPASVEILRRDLDGYLAPKLADARQARDAHACVVPHAGYMYSGHVAGAVYRKLAIPSRVIVLGPNHFGRGAPLATISGGYWSTPLGLVPVDRALSEAIKRNCDAVKEDFNAHAEEHSLEVQLPFLQAINAAFSFAPVAIGTVDYETLDALGRSVAAAVKEAEEPVLVVASSDMNHYEPDTTTRIKDRKAIDCLLALDPADLYAVVHREQISMCGYGAAVAMLVAAKALGAREAVLEKYATSADAGGDARAVVGYAGMIIR
ncbi:MAG: AmmeMemoRadiSam system protein B [Terriglobia bacterium]